MKKFLLIIGMLFPGSSNDFAQSAITAGHTSISEFDSIPENILPEAAKYRIMFRHKSVGVLVNNGLECLQGTWHNEKLKPCSDFPDYKYDCRNWSFRPRDLNGWYEKIDGFIEETLAALDSFDIFAFKFCYLEGLDQTMEPCGNPFEPDKVQKAWDYLKSKMEIVENLYPDKKFIWWTIPLTQIGQRCTDTLNNRIRKYCSENKKWLFDIADIQCHDEFGNKILTPEGLEKAYKPFCGEQTEGAIACHLLKLYIQVMN